MRGALALALTLLVVLGAVGGVAGARWEVRHRLAWGQQGGDPQLSAQQPGAAGEALRRWQQALRSPLQQQRWWNRVWPWAAAPEPARVVRVRPAWPDGTLAAPAELALPPSQLARERRFGLRAAAPSEAAPAAAGAAGEPASPDALYTYNSSEMTPLVPGWLAWMTDVGHMANRTNGLDFRAARLLSSYVAIAYCNVSNIAAWNCSRCGSESPGFAPQVAVFDAAWDLQGYVGFSAELDAIVVAFRGTDSHSYYNWVENMRTWRTDFSLAVAGYPDAPQYAYVHGGFFSSYNASSLAPNVTRAVRELMAQHPRAPVYVTGHSLGGAMATICAMDIRLNLGASDVRVFTFGSPRVGNSIFAEWFRREIALHYRFTHNRDIVPSVPPSYMGFHHVSREIWLVDILAGHTLVGVCDNSGEDARCHNVMCHLGLCSSISDHLLYLSEMYAPHPSGC
eukprot:scaffold7.g3551.t1